MSNNRKVLIQFISFFIFYFAFSSILGCKEDRSSNVSVKNNCEETQGVHEVQGEYLSKEKIIDIAKKDVEENFSETEKLSIYFDVNNVECAQKYKELDPNLFHEDFQAVLFYKKQLIPTPIGEVWVCVDRKTGEVLRRYGYWTPKNN